MRNTFLVCYDISNDARLRRVHKTMCGYGDRLQYSVFECRFRRRATTASLKQRHDARPGGAVLFIENGRFHGEKIISILADRFKD